MVKYILKIAFVLGKGIKGIESIGTNTRKSSEGITETESSKGESTELNQEKDNSIWEKLRCSRLYQKKLKKPYRRFLKFKRELSGKIYLFLRRNNYLDIFMFSLNVYRKTDKVIKQLPIWNIKEYCEKYGQTYVVVEEKKERGVYKAEFWKKDKAIYRKFLSSERYIANIKNAEILGESTILMSDGFLLNDMLYEDLENRIDLRDNSLKKSWKGIAFIAQNEECKKCERAINLISVATYNYYHALVEVLSKLLIVNQYEEYSDYPILVDESVLKISQLKEALNIINYKKHPIITVAKDEKWMVSDLIQVSGSSWLPLNVYHRDMFKMSDFILSEKYLLQLREQILSSVLNGKKNNRKDRKIFISRKNTKTVRLKNEERIRSIFEKNGFEIVYTEEMTFREQVECFNNASYVVSATGAALTNIIFCEPGTKIICIMPKEFRFETYSTIAHMLELIPCFLDAEIVERTPYIAADTYVLDEMYARKFVEEYIGAFL